MLLYQLPKQDLALAYCKYVDKEHTGSYEDFIAARNEIALDIGKKGPVVCDGVKVINDFFMLCFEGYVKDAPQKASCNHCTKTMQQNELAVCAPKLRENVSHNR